ncbi:ACT domain-containing protein [Lactobacillus helveticus]|uniref:ACT domain-containing protein n=1 Tax=Lactobacillus helveticus TaxID=1587 RepID=UPI003F57CFD5
MKQLKRSIYYCNLRKNDFYFFAKIDEELSLVCETKNAPSKTINREDGWRAFKIEGQLDFSLIGILAKIAQLLANNGISIFAVSTFNTDYILVKDNNFDSAIKILSENNYEIK